MGGVKPAFVPQVPSPPRCKPSGFQPKFCPRFRGKKSFLFGLVSPDVNISSQAVEAKRHWICVVALTDSCYRPTNGEGFRWFVLEDFTQELSRKMLSCACSSGPSVDLAAPQCTIPSGPNAIIPAKNVLTPVSNRILPLDFSRGRRSIRPYTLRRHWPRRCSSSIRRKMGPWYRNRAEKPFRTGPAPRHGSS